MGSLVDFIRVNSYNGKLEAQPVRKERSKEMSNRCRSSCSYQHSLHSVISTDLMKWCRLEKALMKPTELKECARVRDSSSKYRRLEKCWIASSERLSQYWIRSRRRYTNCKYFAIESRVRLQQYAVVGAGGSGFLAK